MNSNVKSQTPDFESFDFGSRQKVKVQSIAQNDLNHLFIGTSKGLMLYDGLKIIPVSISDSNETYSITALLFENNTLWIGTSNGRLFRLKGDSLSTFDAKQYIGKAKVNSLKGMGNCIGIATYGEGAYIVADDSVKLHYTTENGLGDDYAYDLEMHNGRLWIGTDAGVTEIDTAENAAFLYSMRNGLPDNIVRNITRFSDSTIAIGMYDLGLCFLNTKTYKFQYLSEGNAWGHGPIESMLLANNGVLWVATKNDGIVWVQIGPNAHKIRSFSAINGLESNRIQTLFQDAENNIWIGTSQGASMFDGSSTEFLTSAEGLPAENIYDFIEDSEGNYWLASDKGVIKYALNSDGQGLVKTYLEHNGQLDRQIVSLLQTKDDKIMMGSYGGGLFSLDPFSEEIRHYDKSDGLSNLNILDLVEDSKGNIWMGTLGSGVICGTPVDGEIKFHQVDELGEQINEYVYGLFMDEREQLWVGMDGSGVAVFDCQTETFRSEYDGLPTKESIYAITQDADGDIWFATDESTLLEYSRGSLIDHALEAGLHGNNVQSLATTSSGDIVAVHQNGFSILPAGESKFLQFAVERDDYVFSPNLNAIYVNGNEVWIGTENGVVKWSRNDLGNVKTPKVSILGLRVLFEDHPLTEGFNFGYSQSHFVFEYQGVWLKSPKDVKYQYKLEGFDKEWSFATESRLATYSSLPPGRYMFSVRASSDGVNWSDPSASSYSFEIKKPFWMQWWFYLVIIIVLGVGLRFFIRYRTQMLIEDKERLEAEVGRRTLEITQQKEIIEVKNEEILSSITYAQRIQSAILPPDSLIKKHLTDSFVLYKPKDIVAGDFYWMESLSGKHEDVVLFASADCTGHGVPGAMVSVVCSNALNQAVREFGLREPAKVLDKTRELVIERFEKSEEEVKDGMDIALCALNLKTNELQYAGANNPLWIVRSGVEGDMLLEHESNMDGEFDNEILPCQIMDDGLLYEIKPTKQPIGKYADPKPYVNHSIQLLKGDSFYIFTDGYADQFGGDRGKKLKYKPFKNLILSIREKQMNDQCEKLDQHFEAWRGEHEQVDDVCVISVRV